MSQSPIRAHVLTHRALFELESTPRCDLCSKKLTSEDDDAGSGLYIWSRGGDLRHESPPLCISCGPMLAMTAQRRWQEEEDEGD